MLTCMAWDSDPLTALEDGQESKKRHCCSEENGYQGMKGRNGMKEGMEVCIKKCRW